MAKNSRTSQAEVAEGKPPTNLSYRRSIDVSEGYLYAIVPDDKGEKFVPVLVETTTVRGAIANYAAGYNKDGTVKTQGALDKGLQIDKPNIQSIDRAALPNNSDTLSLRFAVAFHAASLRPDACNNAAYVKKVREFHEVAQDQGLYRDLAQRYLWNIVNGRVLWRNGETGADAGVTVWDVMDPAKPIDIKFDWKSLLQDRFPNLDRLQAATKSEAGAVDRLVDKIATALSSKRGALLPLEIDIRTRLYRGAEVWPSQEFVEESQKKAKDKREVGRILASREIPGPVENKTVRHAVMHSQKIGNAIRTIDEWHGHEKYGAVPVEVFGWVQRDMAVIRPPSKDAYAHFSKIDQIAEALKRGEERERGLYTLAMLIRGGVFGISGKDDEKSVEEQGESTEPSASSADDSEG